VYVCVHGEQIGHVLDRRNHADCPNFNNLSKKPAAEIKVGDKGGKGKGKGEGWCLSVRVSVRVSIYLSVCLPVFCLSCVSCVRAFVGGDVGRGTSVADACLMQTKPTKPDRTGTPDQGAGGAAAAAEGARGVQPQGGEEDREGAQVGDQGRSQESRQGRAQGGL
jgi:hypothetical protein